MALTTKISLPLCARRLSIHHPVPLPALLPAAMAASEPDRSAYPTPLSPPYPAVSKEVELRRAMSAAAQSGAYKLAADDVVFEDDWMVVANKRSGIYCETLLSAISAAASDPGGTGASQLELHLANRLDRDTSGLMIITKSHKVAAELVKAFTNHKVRKTYLAFCIGRAPDWEKIRISSGHGRSKFGAWRVYSASDVGRTLPGGSVVKHMATSFEVLSINSRGKLRKPIKLEVDETESMVVQSKGDERSGKNEDGNDEILIRAYPESGRTHQIRLHCQHLGLPIRGDAKYGGVLEWKGVACNAHALHAESLSFDHPVTGMPVHLQAPIPNWFSTVSGIVLEDP